MSHPEELHQALQCRDALQLLCDRGYDLHDMLVICEKEIEILTARLQGRSSWKLQLKLDELKQGDQS